MRIEVLSPAKLNLALHITGLLPGGLHAVNSLVVFTEFGDQVAVESAADLKLTINGPFSEAVPTNDDNLILKAAKILSLDRGSLIALNKQVPVESGLGGSSSNAASALKLLGKLWKTPSPSAESIESLGADVPVCMVCGPSLVSGFGDKVSPAQQIPALDVLLVNPGVRLPTKTVFATLKDKENPALEQLPSTFDREILLEWLCRQRNDLAKPAIQLEPVINDVLEQIEDLEGCVLSRMTGSGSTCFGVFKNRFTAHEAEKTMRTKMKKWWTVATTTRTWGQSTASAGQTDLETAKSANLQRKSPISLV